MDLTNPIFNDEEAARKHLERIRWPHGPACPHCGEAENIRKMEGKSHRPGLYKCRSCRKPFSVTVKTIFERSKIPLHKWVLATHLMCSSKKGYSAHQLHRTLGVTYKTAWFMAHRIRESMRETKHDNKLGGGGSPVEADETYWGNKGKHRKGARGWAHKEKILSLVDRKTGKVRSFHVASVNAKTLRPILNQQIEADSHLMTDEAGVYRSKRPNIAADYSNHSVVVHHIGEYVRGDAHTNTVEGYFSILKRGMNGVYQHCSPAHLKRYVGEFDFRYNYRSGLGYDDIDRASIALKGADGKRLMYGGPN